MRKCEECVEWEARRERESQGWQEIEMREQTARMARVYAVGCRAPVRVPRDPSLRLLLLHRHLTRGDVVCGWACMFNQRNPSLSLPCLLTGMASLSFSFCSSINCEGNNLSLSSLMFLMPLVPCVYGCLCVCVYETGLFMDVSSRPSRLPVS